MNVYKSILNDLVKNENGLVREAVAIQGYGLDILINDEDRDVREMAEFKKSGGAQ